MINMRQEGFTSQDLKVYKYMRVDKNHICVAGDTS